MLGIFARIPNIPRLLRLVDALNEVKRAEDEMAERRRVQNALLEIKDTLETLERYHLLEPEWLADMHLALVRVNHALDPVLPPLHPVAPALTRRPLVRVFVLPLALVHAVRRFSSP